MAAAAATGRTQVMTTPVSVDGAIGWSDVIVDDNVEWDDDDVDDDSDGGCKVA